MKRILVIAALTLAAAVPATVGLVGNASFGQSVPVRIPTSAILVDDHGHEVGDDGSRLTPTTASTRAPVTTSAEHSRSTHATPSMTPATPSTRRSDDSRSDDSRTSGNGTNDNGTSGDGTSGNGTSGTSRSSVKQDDGSVSSTSAGTSVPVDDNGGAASVTTADRGHAPSPAAPAATADPNSARGSGSAQSTGTPAVDDNGGQTVSSGHHDGGDHSAGHS